MEKKGRDVIGALLANLVGQGGKRKKLAVVEVLLEVTKSLRLKQLQHPLPDDQFVNVMQV